MHRQLDADVNSSALDNSKPDTKPMGAKFKVPRARNGYKAILCTVLEDTGTGFPVVGGCRIGALNNEFGCTCHRPQPTSQPPTKALAEGESCGNLYSP
jgi:hypothetical protein